MNEQASILFNISSSFSGSHAGKLELSVPTSYLQRSIYTALARTLYTREGFEILGRQLAAIACHAYFARQLDVVEQASQLMLTLPLPKELKAVARHYQALCIWKRGGVDEARRIFSQVIDATSPLYQARGLLSIGATYFGQVEFEAALPHYLAATQVAGECDPQTFATAQKMIAVVRSIYGDHRHALADLEKLFPIVRAIAKQCPTFYYEFLNSYAVELGEVGRLIEAQNVCAVTLASPFAAAYPEFAQTRDELKAKRTAATPSIIAVPAAPEIISSPESQVEAAPARARSMISLQLRRDDLRSRRLTLPGDAVTRFVSLPTILDQLADATLPRGPPVLA